MAVGPVVGALTLLVALTVDGQSFETQDPASAARFVALLVPLGWAGVTYAVGRRFGMSPGGAATAAVLAVVWAIGSVLLVAVAL